MISRVAYDWVAALESGQYPLIESTHTTLRHQNTWSPLGVLCELYRLDNGGEWADGGFKPITGSGSRYWLPEAVMEWAGVRGKFAVAPGVGAIGLMHDRYPLETIVTLIRENKEAM